MIRIESECVDCELPCVYNACPYYKVARLYCDECGEEADLWKFDGEELCVCCILQQLEPVEYED